MLKHLEPLPISEEMLGAYLEGNLTAEEYNYVDAAIQDNDSLKGLVEEVGDSQIDYLTTSTTENYLDFGQDFMHFQLPDLPVNSLDGVQSDLFKDCMLNHSDEYQYNDYPNDFMRDAFMNPDDIY